MARWHRRVALFVMAWLAVLAATGIVINHAGDWGLDRKPLAQPLQHWVYGIQRGHENFCATAPATGRECSAVFARLELPDGELLLAAHSLYLLDAVGRLVEKLPAGQTGIDRLEAGFTLSGAVYLGGGNKTVRTGPDLFDFEMLSPEAERELAGADWQRDQSTAAGVTWERLLLDLHAARFLGPFARAFNDIVGGLILLLAVSGFWLHRIKARTNGTRGRH